MSTNSQTILVTGGTGYIAKHIVLLLLNNGHSVVASVRSMDRESELRNAIKPHLTCDTSLLDTRLRVIKLDLTRDEGWVDAMKGIDVLMHVASPFPFTPPKNDDDVIRPAVDGALRAVGAAHDAGVTRVILTSSTTAVMFTKMPDDRSSYNESDWTDITHPSVGSYEKSKTLAEKAVWDFQAKEAPEMHLTVINPGWVVGKPLDNNFGASIQMIQRSLKGVDPVVPNIGFASVDVEDVALAHLRAMERPEETVGKRFICIQGGLWLPEMNRILKDQFPERKIATRKAPYALMWLVSFFDGAVGRILPEMGDCRQLSNQQSREILGMEYKDVRESVREVGVFLVENGLV